MPVRTAPSRRRLALPAVVALLAGGCRSGAASTPAADAALADTLAARIADAYDFSKPDVVARLMALYPERGPVVSAAAGAVTSSRPALQSEIARFWERVGQNMQRPRFVIGERHLARLGPDAAALTITYSIPHHTPEGRPHTLSGAWTSVWQRWEGGRWVIVQEHLSDPPPQPAAAAPRPADSAHAHGGPP